MGDTTHFHNKCHHRHIHRRTPHAIYYRGHNPCIFRWFGCRVLPRHQSHAFGSCFRYPSALGVEWLSRGKSVREDSAIAVVWALGMAIGIIFIFMTPGYTPGLTEFLFGNILTITRTDIFIFAAFASLLIFYTVLQYKTIVYTAFDADFAHTRGIKTRLVNYIMTFFCGDRRGSYHSSGRYHAPHLHTLFTANDRRTFLSQIPKYRLAVGSNQSPLRHRRTITLLLARRPCGSNHRIYLDNRLFCCKNYSFLPTFCNR